MFSSEDRLKELVKRTMSNLEIIKGVAADEKARSAPQTAHEVTQMVNSALLVILHPWEERKNSKDDFFKDDLKSAELQGWPKLTSSRPIQDGTPPEKCDDPDPTTLCDQMRHLRNGLAHGHIKFGGTMGKEIESIEIENKWPSNRKDNRKAEGKLPERKADERIWGTAIRVAQLEAILKFVSERLSPTG